MEGGQIENNRQNSNFLGNLRPISRESPVLSIFAITPCSGVASLDALKIDRSIPSAGLSHHHHSLHPVDLLVRPVPESLAPTPPPSPVHPVCFTSFMHLVIRWIARSYDQASLGLSGL